MFSVFIEFMNIFTYRYTFRISMFFIKLFLRKKMQVNIGNLTVYVNTFLHFDEKLPEMDSEPFAEKVI